MGLAHPLVAPLVVAGDPGHQLLRVAPLHVAQELRRGGPTKGARVPAVVEDDNAAAADLVAKSAGIGHLLLRFLANSEADRMLRRLGWRDQLVQSLEDPFDLLVVLVESGGHVSL